MSWTVLLCEGAHDQAALSGWLYAAGWQSHKGGRTELPEKLQKAYPTVKSLPDGSSRQPKTSDYFHKENDWIEVKSGGGDNALLRSSSPIFEWLSDHRPRIDAVAVFVDADKHLIDSRVRAYRTAYRTIFPHAENVAAGSVVLGSPKLGLWVAPDNQNAGSLAWLILKSAENNHPDLLAAAHSFKDSLLGSYLDPKKEEDQLKVVLGSAGQVDDPGGSLASALRKRNRWFPPVCTKVPEVQSILEFIHQLVA